MKTSITARILKGVSRHLNPGYYRFNNFVKGRFLLAKAPYPLTYFTDLLSMINLSQHDSLVDFDCQHPTKKGRKWYVRLDIDSQGCLTKAPFVIQAALEAGVKAGVFLRVNSDAYNIQQTRGLIQAFKHRNIAFGLHSECYLNDDWLGRLRSEVETFENILGFSPISINAHGYGSYRWNTRQQFYNGMTREVLAELKISFSDCGNAGRKYNLIIQDCNYQEYSSILNDFRPHRRFLLSDFAQLPPRGWANSFLILIHPTYWIG